jgi:hypothetical protein
LTESNTFAGTPPKGISPIFPSDMELNSDQLHTSKRVGILTSGGDSSGMNAAVRSMTRIALSTGWIPFAIYEGFQGLVDGGSMIKQFNWHDVKGFLAKGGVSYFLS